MTAVMGMGTAQASGLGSGLGSGLNHTLHQLSGQQAKHHKHSKHASGGIAGLPAPVNKVVKKAERDAKSTSKTVQKAVGQLTGASNPPGSPTPVAPGKGNKQHPTSGHHGTATQGHRAGSDRSGNGASRRGAGAISAVSIPNLTGLMAGAPGMTRRPLMAQAPELSPQPASQANKPQASVAYDLLHPTAALPQVVTDPTLRLELLLTGTILAAVVGTAHLVLARRRVLRVAARV
jgi:hypothetical protein